MRSAGFHGRFTGLWSIRVQSEKVRVFEQEAFVGNLGSDAYRSEEGWSGRVLNNMYRVGAPLASGSMGCVYHAEVLASGHAVAVKGIHQRYSADPNIVARFRREAELCGRLNHPNVVTVIDSGQTEDTRQWFTVMELVDGPSLDRLLDDNMDHQRAVRITEQLLAALNHSHAHGIVHRDVKPENLVVKWPTTPREELKLVDFGVALSLRLGEQSQGDALLGTPDYMAPELTTDTPATASADLYSAGVLLFRMITGTLPFTGDLAMDVIIQHAHAKRPDPRGRAPGRAIPRQLAEICVRAMAIHPEERFQSAAEFSRALTALRQSGALDLRHSQLTTNSEQEADALSADGSHDNFSSFLVAEAEIDQMLTLGETDRALEALVGALQKAQEALRGGDHAVGESAIRTFGVQLSDVYLQQGQNERARNVLRGLTKRLPNGAARESLLARLRKVTESASSGSRTA